MRKPRKDKRTGLFHISFHWDGKTYWRGLGSDNLKLAQEQQAAVNLKVSRLRGGQEQLPEGKSVPDWVFGVKSQEETATQRTILGLVENYLDTMKPPRLAESSYKTVKIHLGHFTAFLTAAGILDQPLTKVGVDLFDKYKIRRIAGVSAATVNKELVTLSTMMEQAVKYEWITKNPVLSVDRYKKTAMPHRFLTLSEIEQELAARDYSEKEREEIRGFRYLTEKEIGEALALAEGSWLKPLMTVAAYTGARRSEIIRLAWKDVDFQTKKVWLMGMKGSRTEKFSARDIPMHERLEAVLKAQKFASGRSPIVFPTSSGKNLWGDDLTHALNALTKGTSFEGVGWHTFRHSFASNLAAKGAEPQTIDHFMGHQTKEMRERYKHLFPEKKVSAVALLQFGG